MNMQEGASVSSGKAWFIGAAVLAVAAVVSASLTVSSVRANADYICTHVIDEHDPCANGSWGDRVAMSAQDDMATCVRTQVDQRTYTGTRIIRHIVQYLNLRTRCDAGYTQQQVGRRGGASGNQGRGGDIITESAACQIVETRTTRSGINTGSCATATTTTVIGDPIVDTTITTTDTGTPTITDAHVATPGDLTDFRRSMIRVNIGAYPALVHPGERTTIRWSGREITDCSVTGSNGDGPWAGSSGEQPTSALRSQVTYTANCTAFDGSPVSATTSARLVPVFTEHVQ